jgi:hypothetical protein
MTTVSYVEARRKINAMQRAKDAFGNRLYDDTEIANVFGCESVEALNRVLSRARVGYRKALTKNIRLLVDEGRTAEQIAEIMHLTEETVEVLTDSTIADCLDSHKEAEKARQEMFEKSQKDFDKMFADLFGNPFKV